MPKKKVVKKKNKLLVLTPEQDKILERGLWRTWGDIGGDVMQSMSENEHRSYITQDELLEVVCDAGYCAGVDKEAGALLDKLFDSVDNINIVYDYLKKFFPAKRYS